MATAIQFPDNRMYREIEESFMPMIRRKAARLTAVMPVDDAIQEGRMTLLRALEEYEPAVESDLTRFVSVCLNNAFNTLYRKETAQRRMPRVFDRGTKASTPVRPDELDESVVNGLESTPEELLSYRESEGIVASVATAIEGSLSLRDRLVMWAFVSPPPGLPDPPTNQQVAEYLDINKNALDWSLHKIRKAMLAELRSGRASKSFLAMVTGHGWPFVAKSDKWDDTDFVAQIMWERELDGEITSTSEASNDHGAMIWWNTRWGHICSLRFAGRSATLLMVGRFNPANGLLFGSVCGCEPMPVPWYPELVKALSHGT